jgi:hypothetical protein
MIDADISYDCDHCHRTVYTDELYCDDCYDKLEIRCRALEKQNDQLKSVLRRAGLPIPEAEQPPVFLCPALAEMIQISGGRRS